MALREAGCTTAHSTAQAELTWSYVSLQVGDRLEIGGRLAREVGTFKFEGIGEGGCAGAAEVVVDCGCWALRRLCSC